MCEWLNVQISVTMHCDIVDNMSRFWNPNNLLLWVGCGKSIKYEVEPRYNTVNFDTICIKYIS